MSSEVSIYVSPGGFASTGGAGGADVQVEAPKELSGWTDVEVTLRAEGLPPTFRLAAAPGQPLGKGQALATAGDGCIVRFDGEPVTTGYITGLLNFTTPEGHRVELAGGGKTLDLAETEIEWDTSRTYLAAGVAAIEAIAEALDLEVEVRPGVTDPPIPYPLQLDFGQPAGSYLSQITRAMGVLAYESARGTLVIATAGTTRAASGAEYGANVQEFAVTNSMEGRFSEVRATLYRQNQFLEGDVEEPNFFFTARDPAVKRHRIKHVFLENGPEGLEFAKRMALWEVARRAARGSLVRVTVDSWRDSAGKLWTPNTIVPVKLPGLSPTPGGAGAGSGSVDLCLSEVTFRRNGQTGTTAELQLMPVEGFVPEPIQLTNANLVGVLPAASGPVNP